MGSRLRRNDGCVNLGATLGNVDVTHLTTEACLAVAESHVKGGAWVELPMQQRDLYVFHV